MKKVASYTKKNKKITGKFKPIIKIEKKTTKYI